MSSCRVALFEQQAIAGAEGMPFTPDVAVPFTEKEQLKAKAVINITVSISLNVTVRRSSFSPKKAQFGGRCFGDRRRHSPLPLMCCERMYSVLMCACFLCKLIWRGSGGWVRPHIFSKASYMTIAHYASVGIHQQSRSHSHLPPTEV